MQAGGKPGDLADGHESILASTFCQQYDRRSRPIHENRHNVYLLSGNVGSRINGCLRRWVFCTNPYRRPISLITRFSMATRPMPSPVRRVRCAPSLKRPAKAASGGHFRSCPLLYAKADVLPSLNRSFLGRLISGASKKRPSFS
jgi:hypothetical protein